MHDNDVYSNDLVVNVTSVYILVLISRIKTKRHNDAPIKYNRVCATHSSAGTNSTTAIFATVFFQVNSDRFHVCTHFGQQS